MNLRNYLRSMSGRPNRIRPADNKKLRTNAGERRGDHILVKGGRHEQLSAQNPS